MPRGLKLPEPIPEMSEQDRMDALESELRLLTKYATPAARRARIKELREILHRHAGLPLEERHAS